VASRLELVAELDALHAGQAGSGDLRGGLGEEQVQDRLILMRLSSIPDESAKTGYNLLCH
jgi:hypothetical protein